MAPKLHLYMTPGSCALASHIALRHSGLAFTLTDLQAKTGYPAEHLHLNSKARVPILDVDGDLITESPAIMSTISALAPDKHLLGKDIVENARAHEWLAWLCNDLHGQAFGARFRPQRFVTNETMYDAVRARGLERIKECFAYIEGQLDGRVHAVGDAFTVVDGYLLVFYRWGNRCRLGMQQSYPNYTRMVQNVIEIESVRRTIEVEGIDPLYD